MDFNAYAPKTDPLLFTYEELRDLLVQRSELCFRVIESRSDPRVNRNAPLHQHNMVPFEALSLGSGNNEENFANALVNAIVESIDPPT